MRRFGLQLYCRGIAGMLAILGVHAAAMPTAGPAMWVAFGSGALAAYLWTIAANL